MAAAVTRQPAAACARWCAEQGVERSRAAGRAGVLGGEGGGRRSGGGRTIEDPPRLMAESGSSDLTPKTTRSFTKEMMRPLSALLTSHLFGPRTEEMMQPCLLYSHIVSLVRALKRWSNR